MATVIPSSNKLQWQTQAIMEAMGNLGQGIGRLIERKRQENDMQAFTDWMGQQQGGAMTQPPDVQINAGIPSVNAAAGIPLPMNIPRPAQQQFGRLDFSTLPKFKSQAGRQLGMGLISEMAQKNMLSPMDMQDIVMSQRLKESQIGENEAQMRAADALAKRRGEMGSEESMYGVVPGLLRPGILDEEQTKQYKEKLVRGSPEEKVGKLNADLQKEVTDDGIPKSAGLINPQTINLIDYRAKKIGMRVKRETKERDVPGKLWGTNKEKYTAYSLEPIEGDTEIPENTSEDFDATYEALPSGAEFTAPDGTRRRKP